APEIAAHLQIGMRPVEEPIGEVGGEQRVALLHVLLVVGPRVREARRPGASVEAEARRSRAAVPRVDQISRVLKVRQLETLDALAAALADEARADVVLLAVEARRLVETTEGAFVDEIHRQKGLRVRDGRFLEELRLPLAVADDGDAIAKLPHA